MTEFCGCKKEIQHTEDTPLQNIYWEHSIEEELIGVGYDMERPPRAQDLTPLDLSLYGHLKGRIFAKSSPDLDDLRTRITT